MKKFLKFVLGLAAIAGTVCGVVYFIKNVLGCGDCDYFEDDDDDDFDDEDEEESSDSDDREYVTLDMEEDAENDTKEETPDEEVAKEE